MNLRLFYTLFALSLLGLFFLGNSAGRATQANDGNTGAPGENGTVCGTCHNGGAFGTLSEVLEIKNTGGTLVTEYLPGETYTVTLTVSTSTGTPSGYGFQMTSLDGSNAEKGAWQNTSANTKIATAANIAGGRTYLEQTSTSASGVFSAEWVAPAMSTGTVTFYYVGNAVNGTGSTASDLGSMGSTLTLTEDAPITCNLSATTSSQSTACNGSSDGSATATPANGTAPYTYMWNNNSSSNPAINLSAGNYTVTITDSNGCTAISSTTVTEPTLISPIATVSHVLCANEANGSITIDATNGGAPPYVYSLDGINYQVGTVFGGLAAASYTVFITDSNGCEIFFTATVTEPNALMLSASIQGISAPGASDGSITATVAGGTPPYSYSWNIGTVSPTVSDLVAGEYCVTVTDANNCTISRCDSVSNFTAVQNLVELNEMTISPNPASSQTSLSLDFSKVVDLEVSLINVLGQKLWKQSDTKVTTGQYSLDLEAYPAGLYFVRVTVDNRSVVRRLFIGK